MLVEDPVFKRGYWILDVRQEAVKKKDE